MFYRFLPGAVALVILAITSNACMAAGATAVGEPADIAKDGVAIFTQVNAADSKTAKAQALAGCKGLSNASDTSKALCKVVATFENQCVAQALDPQSGTPGFGWAMAADPKAAKEQALSNCRDTAGPTRQDACIVDDRSLWCDGSASVATAPSAPSRSADLSPRPDGPPSREQIQEIQSRLFDLNYELWLSGSWDAKTRKSIRKWHENTKRPGTDTMSEDDIAYLRTATPIKIWAGVVFEARGHYRMFSSETSRKELVDKEVSYCRAHFRGKSCSVEDIHSVTAGDDQCLGVTHAEWRDGRITRWGTYAASAVGIDAAKEKALSDCVDESGTSRRTCKLVAAICADGSSQTGPSERR